MAEIEAEEVDLDELEGDEEYESELLITDEALEGSANLVHELMTTEEGKKLCGEIASKCLIEFHAARDSSEAYRSGQDKDWRIFLGDIPPKDGIFSEMANMSVPQSLENITRLWFRGAGELFGDWGNLFGVLPTGPDDQEVATLLTRHGNWQLGQIPDFQRQQLRGLLMFYQFGDVTFYSFWDPRRKCNRHVALDIDEFYVPYTSVSVMSDWSDVPYRGLILNYYRQDLEKHAELWYGVDKVLQRQSTWEDEPDDDVMRRGIAKIQGEELPSDGPAPYKLIMHQTWYKLPGQDRSRFLQMVVDVSTKSLLFLALHEAPSFEEAARYRYERAGYDAYVQAKASYDQMTAQTLAQAGAVPQEVQDQLLAFGETGAPPRPEWMKPGEDGPPRPPEMSPINEFSHAICIEPLRGAYGFGFGRAQSQMNRVANSLANHIIDASSLANFPAIFVSSTAGLNKLRLGPGMTNPVITSGKQSVKDLITTVSVTGDSMSLFEFLKYTDQRSREGIQSPQVLSGEPGKSGETARGLEARIGEATKQLSVSTRQYANQGLLGVLKQNARLNTIYMPESQPFFANDERGNPQLMTAGRRLYQEAMPYRVIIKSDLMFTSDASRIANADGLVMQSLKDPMLAANPHFGYQARKQALEARRLENFVPLLGAPPEGVPPAFGTPPQPPPGMKGQPPGPPPQGGPQG